MTTLSPAVSGSMHIQMETVLTSVNLKLPGLKSTFSGFSSAHAFNTSANPNRQLLACFISPNTANIVYNPSDAAAAPNFKPLATSFIGFLLRRSPRALESAALGLASSARSQSGTNSPTQEISVDQSSLRIPPTFWSPPALRSAFHARMALPLPMVSTGFSSKNNNAGRTADLAAPN
ncbi:hypothetical protein H4582DRAFT_2078419 [Lactarius indigo]|nr:hypothetical protein H4582DRAFT_2078419 [Lactarius indigo]